MKQFASEIGQNYDSYSFGYCLYAERETTDSLSDIYAAGYLPYSGSPDVKNIAYMARSIRISLDQWKLTSENRRIYRKFEGMVCSTRPVEDKTNQAAMVDFCCNYFASRHSSRVMPRERLLHILDSGWVTQIAEYSLAGNIIAYIWLGRDSVSTHFYYSFYDLSYTQQSLGLWLMVDMIVKTQISEQNFLYLGTVYGQKGKYKTNFSNLEWWNGRDWVANRNSLRALCVLDDTRVLTLSDRWKNSVDLF